MARERVRVEHVPMRLTPDPDRVIARFFSTDEERTRARIERVLCLPESEAESILSGLLETHGDAQADLADTWSEHFRHVESFLPSSGGRPGRAYRLLIGAYFTMHYALQSAALFNPSIVPQLGQTGEDPGGTRFILSLRAVGEGHLSSVVFRTGTVSADGSISIDDPEAHYRVLNADPEAQLDTEELRSTLAEMGQLGPVEEEILAGVGGTFSVAGLLEKIEHIRVAADSPVAVANAKETLLSIVGSNYRIHHPEGINIHEAVLFPASANETRGIEDLRLVRFTDEDGAQRYYGTYTAYNGLRSYPTLLEIPNREIIESHTLMGKMARNKGMALFPRKISGRYVMSGRVDGENLYILQSSSVRVWNEGRLCMQPKYWWEYAVIGNCGSPIETSEGWLLLTHGVGPMRHYCVGAVLLDLDDPARVIARLSEPLIAPSDDAPVGYVPNVVYTCGAMLHGGTLIIPYAMSDMVTTFARVELSELLEALRDSPE